MMEEREKRSYGANGDERQKQKGEKHSTLNKKNYKLFHLMQTHKITGNVNRNNKSAEKIRWNSHFLLAAVPIVHSRTHSCAVSAPDMQFDDAQ